MLFRRADSDFVTCPTFHWIGQTDPKLVRASLQLANRPSLAGYWKFNPSLLEIGDFWERLETLILRALVGAVTGNKLWGYLKYRIRDFAIKYDRQLKLNKTKKATSLDDKFSRVVERGDSLALDRARRDLKRDASEWYKSFVVRSRLKRVPNEAVKCNAFACEKEVRKFPHRYIEFVKSSDAHAQRSNREMREAFRDHFARLSRHPGSGVLQLFSRLLSP